MGAVALAATGVGAVGSIGLLGATTAAAGASAATVSTLATIATVATVAQVAAAGLSVASALTAKKPAGSGSGSQTEFSADPFAGVPYLMGRTGTKGNIVFRQASDGWSLKDTPNDLCDLITIFSGAGPVDGYESFTSDKTPISFDGAGNAIGEFRDKMFQRRQLGACPEPSALTVQAGSSARPNGWSASHKLPGLAAAIWRLRYDSKQRFFQNGVPAPLWVIRGVKVYDPRLDSTYPGGSGSHRWDNEATWAWSENPYLHALAWVIGRHQNGKRVMGLGAPIDQIIVSDFVEGANVANANGWTVGGVVYSRPDTKWNVLKQILQAGAGEPLRVGARIGCLINTPRVSLSTITVADIIGDAKLTAMQPIRSRLNTVTPRYRSEANDWEIVPAAPIVVPAHIAEDGDERSKEIEYSLVQNVTQAASLARYDIENTREFGPVTMPLKPKWLNYKAGDCVTLEVPEAFGQKMLILKRTIDPASAVVTFEMRSETDGKHPFALGQTTTPPPTATVRPADPPVPPPSPDSWSASAIDASAGIVTPTIVVTGAVSNGNVDAVIFEYRVYDASALPEAGWTGANLEASSVTRTEITGLLPATAYEVGVRYRARGVIGDRLLLGPVTTADISTKGEPGTDGLPGAPGVDGRTSYVHYAYADSADGAVNFTTEAPGNRAFVGIYTDFTAADSTNPVSYVWAQYVGPSSFGLAASGDVVVSGSKLVKRSSGGWGTGGGYSTEGWKNAAQAAWTSQAPPVDIMAGLNTDPSANDSYESIDYAWYMANDGGCDIYESGGYCGRFGTFGNGTRFQVAYDGKIVRYYLDGVLKREVAAAAGLTLYFDAAIAGGTGSEIRAISFGASGTAGTDGAPGTRGDDGLPGAPGANGVSSYTAYAYANSPDGSVDFTTGEPGARGFIGICANLTSNYEPTTPASYTWSQYRGPPFGIATRGSAVVVGNTVLRSNNEGGWDSDAFSTSAYTGAASVSFRLTSSGGGDIMAGLNTDPLTDSSYMSLDYAFYRSGVQLFAYESGVQAFGFGGVADATRLRIDYNGRTITYFIDDVPRRQIAVGRGLTYYFDSSLASICRLEDLTFTGGSQIAPAVNLVGDTPRTYVSGSEIRGMPPDGGWGSVHAHSIESYARGAAATWTIPAGSNAQNAMIGLSVAQTSGTSFEGITFSIFQQQDGYVDARVNGNGIIAGPVVNTGVDNNYKLHFDGETVRYFANGVQFGTFAWGRQPDPLYFVAAMASSNPRATNITFTAAGTVGTDGRDGLNGNNGAPGAPGANGQSSYLHIAYANSPDGSVDFTTGAPGSRAYLGTLVDQTIADSTNPAAYAWSLVKGADGLNGTNGTPGAPGANGQPTYIHIAYANSADGNVDFSLDNPAGRTYVGFYVDQQVADSGNPAAYAWSLVKGADGAQGPQGPQGPPGADGAAGQVLLSDGAATINIANSGTGSTVVVSSAISVAAGGKFRLTLAGTDPVNNTGGSFFGARVIATVNFANGTSQTLFDKNAFLNSDGELNDANLLAASSNLIANASAGAATLVIQHTRSGQPGNSGSFRLSYVLERL
ncbi:hypothetical protein ASE72_02055 [Sphingomonas sp. Leaf20]|nr:hypothetical protein ASE72_02055 [Sphingomonas sp. Leaf20]